MQVSLAGQVIIITGAASGVGAAIAKQAARSGAEALILTDRDVAGLADSAARCGATAATCVADLSDETAPQTIVAAALSRFGRVDGLVNAAAVTTRASFVDGDPSIWDSVMAINARAPFFLMQGAIRDMAARGADGSIVNVLSVNAACGIPELAIYSASKGALATLTRNAANAHLADRIRVNGINLGWTLTPAEDHMQAVTLGKGPDWIAAVAAGMPLGRLLEPAEAARLAVWLLSPQSAPMTGLALDLDQRVAAAP